MEQKNEQLETLNEIRDIMDRSTRFLSLSGLSGIFAGLSALAGAAVVKFYLIRNGINYYNDAGSNLNGDQKLFLFMVAAGVLAVAFLSATYFTARNARRKNQRPWDHQSKRLLVNLAIPLATGGLFCALLLYHNVIFLIAPAMLIFYGLALLNGSKYSIGDIRYLGLFEIATGLLAALLPGYGLLLWTFGFGILHIVYGTLVWFKYER
jgi:heme/copper-type cytochrome/quinol oxidase subunit 2